MSLGGFQPTAQHASDFCAQRLCLEDFCGVGEVEFEVESEFEDGDFELTSGFDEVRCLERFWQSEENLSERNLLRINERLSSKSVSSYAGIMKKHGNKKQTKHFNWLVYEWMF